MFQWIVRYVDLVCIRAAILSAIRRPTIYFYSSFVIQLLDSIIHDEF